MRFVILLLVFISTTLQSVAQAQNEVVIDEIMCDPTPVVQPGELPEFEFVELKNVSSYPVNLNGWKISDRSSTATINTNFILQPDSFVVVCSAAAASSLVKFGRTLAVSNFPSLDNDGDVISLASRTGKLVHAVEYNKRWYRNELKSTGGWTLEMTDTRNPCSGYSNWKASIHESGGTPGRKNSTDAVNPDELAPVLLGAFATDSLNVILVFDEPLDSTKAVSSSSFFVDHGIGTPLFARVLHPVFASIHLRLDQPLKRNFIYTAMVKNISDCAGNRIGIASSAKLGLSTYPSTNDVVINEVLFDPVPGAVDYVEIYNRSLVIIDLKELHLANRTTSGTLNSPKQLTGESRLLFPGEYAVITEDPDVLKQHHTVRNSGVFLALGTMPSFPDDKGHVVLLNSRGLIIDEFRYDENMHFKLIVNKQGVSLERINYNLPAQDPMNWYSAATTAGYGTPGYQNSQFMQGSRTESTITVSPQTFSPDGDGFNDFVTINYQFVEQGFVCNLTIFDANGRPVRYLVRGAVCGLEGHFRWDGLDEKQHYLNTGIYIILTEIFKLNGKTDKFKRTVVLARR